MDLIKKENFKMDGFHLYLLKYFFIKYNIIKKLLLLNKNNILQKYYITNIIFNKNNNLENLFIISLINFIIFIIS
jgi:hypothetical protein